MEADTERMESQHLNFPQVYTEGRLIVEFTFDDMMRIRSWHFAVRNHRELIPRNILAMQEPGMIESLSKNVTRQGLTSKTLNYLRVRIDMTRSSDLELPLIILNLPSFSCALFWNPCRSSCRGTRRTPSTRGTASRRRCSRSGRRWWRRQVKVCETT